jgi:hypothetical protein
VPDRWAHVLGEQKVLAAGMDGIFLPILAAATYNGRSHWPFERHGLMDGFPRRGVRTRWLLCIRLAFAAGLAFATQLVSVHRILKLFDSTKTVRSTVPRMCI